MRLLELEQVREGGNAVAGVGPINQENVEATLKAIYSDVIAKLNISPSDTASLGSTGKKAPGQSSGDIDLAISIQALVKNNNLETPGEVYDFILEVAKSTGHETRDMRGLGIISLAWPIENTNGQQPDALVQLDLMTVDSVDWARWAYFAPSFDQSPWKGLYRNEIIIAIAKHMNYKTIKRAMDKDGQEVDAEWERDYFTLSKGLETGTQTRMGKKGITKAVKTINKALLTNDPQEAVKMLFGPDAEPGDFETFEQAFAAVMSDDFVYADKRDAILKMAKDGILKKGYPVPPELDKVA